MACVLPTALGRGNTSLASCSGKLSHTSTHHQLRSPLHQRPFQRRSSDKRLAALGSEKEGWSSGGGVSGPTGTAPRRRAPDCPPGTSELGLGGMKELRKRGGVAKVSIDLTDGQPALSATGRSATAPPPRNPLGYAALFGVALLWGSYTPSLRFLFLSDDPPSAPMLNALQACLSAMFLIGSGLFASVTHKDPPESAMSNPLMAEAAAIAKADMQIMDEADHRLADHCADDWDDDPGPSKPSSLMHMFAEALNWKTKNILLAGGELGLWTCLAFGLEVLGVQHISATKAAFLNQATVLITPVLVHLSGEHVQLLEWAACALGLGGSILVAMDHGGGGGGHGHGPAVDAGMNDEVLGVIYVLVSALFFAISTVRLSRYSPEFPSLRLASASTCGLAVFSLAWVLAANVGSDDTVGHQVHVLTQLLTNPLSLAVLLWVGVGPGAMASFLQATGQSSVPPAQAQVIYATTPLFATACAMVALGSGDEAMGNYGWAGAGFMLTAAVVASISGTSPTSDCATDSMNAVDSSDRV